MRGLALGAGALLLVSAGCRQPEAVPEGNGGPAAAPSAATLTQLTSGPATDGFVEFSPDGSQIAFVSDRDGAQRLWTMSVQGGRRRR